MYGLGIHYWLIKNSYNHPVLNYYFFYIYPTKGANSKPENKHLLKVFVLLSHLLIHGQCNTGQSQAVYNREWTALWVHNTYLAEGLLATILIYCSFSEVL